MSLTVFLIALGLSMDSFAVSVSCGLMYRGITFINAVKITLFLALFQGLMPVAGWFLGESLVNYVADYDHWIAFILLFFLGARMAVNAMKKEEVRKTFNPLNIWVILGFSLATSIDALVVGFSFAFIGVHILEAALVIGVVTFIVSMLGVLFGKRAGAWSGRWMEFAGGLILIAIGTKTLAEHLNFF